MLLSALLCLAAAPAPTPPATSTIPDELRQVAKQMEGIHTLQVTMRQEKELAAFGDVIRSEGTLVVARPRRLAMDLQGPGGTRLVIDGDQMTLRYKALQRTERLSLARDPRAKALADHLFLFLDVKPEAVTQTYDVELLGRRPLAVRLLPRPDALRRIIRHVDLRFDARGFVDELLLQEANGDRTRWAFDEPRVDAPIDEAAFKPGD